MAKARKEEDLDAADAVSVGTKTGVGGCCDVGNVVAAGGEGLGEQAKGGLSPADFIAPVARFIGVDEQRHNRARLPNVRALARRARVIL